MRFPWSRETRAAHPDAGTPADTTYTDLLIAALEGAAADTGAVDALALAAVETAAGLYARAFASADVSPDTMATRAVTPTVLALIGRELVRRGEAVFYIDVDARRESVALMPAARHNVTGPPDEGAWFYRVTMAGASATTTRVVPGPGIVHARYAVDPQRPWQGLSPLRWSRETATLAARIERHLSTDMTGPVGQFGAIVGTGAQAEAVAQHLRGLKGSVALMGEHAMQNAASSGVRLTRIGAEPADTIPMLREQVTVAVLAACGVPPELASGGAETARREAWRQFLHGTIAPVGRLVAAELAAKLAAPDLRLSFDALMASDVQGRARSWRSLVGKDARMRPEIAARLVGFDEA